MNSGAERHVFASDNTAPICPEAWAALVEVNRETVPSYGEDRWSVELRQRVREIFDTDCQAFLVFNGTAANALALSQMVQPFQSIVCHERAHIETDECGAPEFFSGSKLLVTPGANGKLDLHAVAEAIDRQPEWHSHRPRVLSFAQATELGTVYSRFELDSIADFARKRGLLIHMDGARFANSVATLGCAPKEITWQAGIDVLSFGGTKNGLGAGELVVFFRKELARDFEYRLKQAGQLGSKMRFLAAPWLAILKNDVWLRNARHANSAATNLADRLQSDAGLDAVFPVEANAVFVRMNPRLFAGLQQRGWRFYQFIEPDIYRLMCSWMVTDRDIADFVKDAASLAEKQ